MPNSLPAQQERSQPQNIAPAGQVSIREVHPNPVHLTVGGDEVVISLSGTNLARINAVQVVAQRKLIPYFEVRMDPASGNSGNVRLKAKPNAGVGNYQIRVIAGAQAMEIPASMVRIEVHSKSSSIQSASKQPLVAPPQSVKGGGARPKDLKLLCQKAHEITLEFNSCGGTREIASDLGRALHLCEDQMSYWESKSQLSREAMRVAVEELQKNINRMENLLLRAQNYRAEYLTKPKHCKEDIKNITPTLPSPLRGGGLGWGGK